MANQTLFNGAGFSRRNGLLTFRGTNRDPVDYQMALENVGDEDILLVSLPNAMTKLDAKKYLLAHADFQGAEHQAALGARGVTAIKIGNTPAKVVPVVADEDEFNGPLVLMSQLRKRPAKAKKVELEVVGEKVETPEQVDEMVA